MAVVEAEQFGAKSDREDEHPHTAQAGHQKVAKLMKKHDNTEHE
jgi:hypothetical protein